MRINRDIAITVVVYLCLFLVGFVIGRDLKGQENIAPIHETVIPKQTDFASDLLPHELFAVEAVYEDSYLNLFVVLDRFPRIVRLRDAYGRTILMHAVALGDIDVLRTLLHFDANMSDRDVFGRTPFSYMQDDDREVHILLAETWSEQRLGR